MDADRKHPIVHLVGSIPLPDAESVFRTVTAAVGPHLVRLPDGETGIRKTWIRFLQDVLANNPAIELAADVPPFKFTQWDGKVVRENLAFASSRVPRPMPSRSRPATPIWRWNRGACSIACSRLASFRRR